LITDERGTTRYRVKKRSGSPHFTIDESPKIRVFATNRSVISHDPPHRSHYGPTVGPKSECRSPGTSIEISAPAQYLPGLFSSRVVRAGRVETLHVSLLNVGNPALFFSASRKLVSMGRVGPRSKTIKTMKESRRTYFETGSHEGSEAHHRYHSRSVQSISGRVFVDHSIILGMYIQIFRALKPGRHFST
jgi:hypothetical protein